MKNINLYQAAFRPIRVILPARRLLAGGMVFLCGILALYAWEAWRLAQLRREVGQVTARATRLETRAQASFVLRQADQKVLSDAENIEARLRNLQRAQEALASGALGSETGYSAQFRALARARVDGAWLTRVEIGSGGHEVNLRGRALSGEAPARLIASLHREPLFVGLSFAALTLSPPQDKAAPSQGAAESDKVAEKAPTFLEFALSAHLDEAGAKPEANPALQASSGKTP